MPITPLHFGVLAPINHFAPNKVSNVSFILVSLWMDANSIMYVLFGLPGVAHGEGHTFVGASILAAIVSVFGFRSRRWIYGAFLGGISHVPLDMLVHPEMHPFHPIEGNPFYLGWMGPLSLALLPLMVWLIAQYVSAIGGWVQRRRVA